MESAAASRHLDAEQRMREILRNAGLPKPDEVRYEFEPDEVVFKWTEPKFAVVIDLEDDGLGGIEFPPAEGTRPAPGRLAGQSTVELNTRKSREAGSRLASMGPLARTLNGWEPPGPRI